MNAAGIQHNGQTPHPSHAGSVANAAQTQAVGVPAKQTNNYNGDIAEKAIADRPESQGYTVKRNIEINTPLGKRDVDILATKHQGHPTLSEEIHIESKVGRKSLPSTAQGSNVRMQIDKDAAVLAQQKSLGPAAQVRGRQLYDQGTTALKKSSTLAKAGKAVKFAGKVARPIGIAISTLEIGSAFQADGNRIGINTAGKVTSLAGGAGGAWAGAAAGAALGSVVPGVGTVIGGIVGGIVSSLAGENVATKAFNAVKGWFS